MEQNGGDYKSIRYIESPLSDMAPALVQGRIDAALVLEPFVPAARKTCRQIGKPYDAIAPRFLVAGYFATEDWARKNVDVVRRFQQAMRLAADWANANQDRSGEILVARAKLNPTDVKQMVREQYQERLDVDLIQPVIDAAAKYGGTPHFPRIRTDLSCLRPPRKRAPMRSFALSPSTASRLCSACRRRARDRCGVGPTNTTCALRSR
jgi:ABC-type nitrate/sulfonate/bicarbonate transport system substrate-binding protein